MTHPKAFVRPHESDICRCSGMHFSTYVNYLIDFYRLK
ncbi:hypothetical protein PUN4_80016 [Paraburkholderia unamae]|nr:hypothetical protein PUN4_80016 [Paraburkholderia unamae]